MIEASSSAPSSRLLPSAFSSTTWMPFSSSSVPMVSAPTPRRFLISRWMASLEARIGLRFRPGKVFSASGSDLDALFFLQRADGVRADAEAFFNFALDGFARGENRLEVQAGQSFQRVESLRGKQTACRDFDVAVHALERKQFLLQQNARGKK